MPISTAFLSTLTHSPLSALAAFIILVALFHVIGTRPPRRAYARPTDKPPVAGPSEVRKRFYGEPMEAGKGLDFGGVEAFKGDGETKGDGKREWRLEKQEPEEWWRDGYIGDREYRATMAIRNIHFDDWVRMDKNFPSRMALKSRVYAEYGTDAIDCREGGYDGCAELLQMLVQYLPRRFPSVFQLSVDGAEIENRATGETFVVAEGLEYGGLHPLRIVGGLIEDDVVVLTEGEDGGEYVLRAAIAGFPAGFNMREKMGQPLTEIHKPVPTYEERLKKSMNKFFQSVTPSKMVMRVNWSINDREELVLLEGGHLYENDAGADAAADEQINIDEVQLRVERQVIRRLPRSGAMCMLTKTYLYRLVDIAHEPGFAARMAGLLHKLPERLAFYKRKPVWGRVVLGYLDEMARKYPAESSTDDKVGS